MRATVAIVPASLALALAACASAPEPRSPAAPARERSTPEPGAPTPATPTTQPALVAPQAGAAQPGVATSPWSDLESAESQLDTSGGECSVACRALGSMERACGRLCVNTDQASRCDESRTRVRTARGRIRAACRACPGGPSLDDKAPIPST